MKNLSDDAIIYAYNKGYRVVDGKVISPITGKPRVLKQTDFGYFAFSITNKRSIKVHRLVAYQKYGNKIFENGIQDLKGFVAQLVERPTVNRNVIGSSPVESVFVGRITQLGRVLGF